MFFFFFLNYPATTEIYTLSLHDALPICLEAGLAHAADDAYNLTRLVLELRADSFSDDEDRKSTRLNSSHSQISYAVFCLKKKKKRQKQNRKKIKYIKIKTMYAVVSRILI